MRAKMFVPERAPASKSTACCRRWAQVSCGGSSRRDAVPQCESLCSATKPRRRAPVAELIGLRNARPLEHLLLHRFTDAERSLRAATPQRGATRLKVDNCAKMTSRASPCHCEFSTRSPQHEPACRRDEAAFGKCNSVFVKSARAKRLSEKTAEMTWLLICPKCSPLVPKLKIVSCRLFYLDSDAIPLPAMAKFLELPEVVFAVCGVL